MTQRTQSTATPEEVKPLANGGSAKDKSGGKDGQVKAAIRKSSVNVLVMDSASCWVICFAVFVIYCLAAAFNRALTICFLDLVKLYNVSITTTSLSFTFQLVAISISALLVMNVVVPITGERVSTVTGCVGNSLCTIGVGLAPNISVFLICMAGKGLFIGISFVPAIAMISQYFERRRSIATALAYCGLGVGAMVAPPLIEYLKENFGIYGMFLLVGALEMNSIPAAMMLRPLSRYKYVISGNDSDDEVEDGEEETDTEGEENGVGKPPLADKVPQMNSSEEGRQKLILPQKGPNHGLKATEIYTETVKCDAKQTDANDIVLLAPKEQLTSEQKYSELAASSPSSNGFQSYEPSGQNSSKRRSLSFKDETANVYLETTEPLVPNGRGGRAVVTTQLSADSKVETYNTDIDDSRYAPGSSTVFEETGEDCREIHSSKPHTPNHRHLHPKASPMFYRVLSHPGNSSHTLHAPHLPRDRHMSSTWSIASAPMSEMTLDVEVIALENAERRSLHTGINQNGAASALQLNGKLGEASVATKPLSCWGKTRAVFLGIFSMDLLRTWSLRILLLGASSGALVQYLQVYLPTLASKQGMSPSEVALMLTVSGGVDLASRILVGLFTDLKLLTPGQVTAITQVIIATVMHFTHFYTDFNSLMFLSIILGLFGSSRQNLGTLITIEFMGLARFRRALGFQAMVSTLSLAVHHPLLSAILEATGSFAPPLHYVGIILYMSSALVLMAPLAKRWDAKNEARRQRDNTIVPA